MTQQPSREQFEAYLAKEVSHIQEKINSKYKAGKEEHDDPDFPNSIDPLKEAYDELLDLLIYLLIAKFKTLYDMERKDQEP